MSDLTSSKSYVTCSTDAVDIGAFFGFTLLEDGLECSSIAQAIRSVAGDTTERMAVKLVIIQIGQAPLDMELTQELENLAYRDKIVDTGGYELVQFLVSPFPPTGLS